jgi:PEP-CTERM motif
MRKLSIGAVILAAGFVAFGSSPAWAIVIELVPSSQAVALGGQAEVDLVISGLGDLTAPSLGTFDLDVSFDPALLGLLVSGVTYGDPVLGDQLDLLGLGSLTSTTVGVGSVNLFELSLDLPDDLNNQQAGTFTLATLTFDGVGPGSSTLGLSIVALGDALGEPLTAEVRSALVTVVSEAVPVPEPGTLALVASGLVGLGAAARRRRRRR